MSDKRQSAHEQLDKLIDSIVEEILHAPDFEIISEAKEKHGDVDSIVSRTRQIIASAIAMSGKAKMQIARKAYSDANALGRRVKLLELPLSEKRELLERVAAAKRLGGEQITLAARKGTAMGEKDVDAILEALIDLGAIDDQDDSP